MINMLPRQPGPRYRDLNAKQQARVGAIQSGQTQPGQGVAAQVAARRMARAQQPSVSMTPQSPAPQAPLPMLKSAEQFASSPVQNQQAAPAGQTQGFAVATPSYMPRKDPMRPPAPPALGSAQGATGPAARADVAQQAMSQMQQPMGGAPRPMSAGLPPPPMPGQLPFGQPQPEEQMV